MNTGITSSLNEIGRSTKAAVTLTGTLTAFPPHSTVISVAPSAAGRTTLLSSLTRAGLATVTLASAVTSRASPSANQAWTTNDWRSRAVSRLTSGGKTSSAAGDWDAAVPRVLARTRAAKRKRIAIWESLVEPRIGCQLDGLSWWERHCPRFVNARASIPDVVSGGPPPQSRSHHQTLGRTRCTGTSGR